MNLRTSVIKRHSVLLTQGSVSKQDGVTAAGQGAIRCSRRGNPPVPTEPLDLVRTKLAKATNVKMVLSGRRN